MNPEKAKQDRTELAERRFDEWAERTQKKGWFSFWTRPIQLVPDETVVFHAGAVNDHAWHRSYGALYLTDRRLIFQGAFAPFSMAPLGHRHIWQLTDIEATGESRHVATLFVVRNMYVQVGGRVHFFVTEKRGEWLQHLTKAGIRRE